MKESVGWLFIGLSALVLLGFDSNLILVGLEHATKQSVKNKNENKNLIMWKISIPQTLTNKRRYNTHGERRKILQTYVVNARFYSHRIEYGQTAV